MSNSSILDRESFQNLLASAFVVQQSRMDAKSLSAIVEVERLIKRGEADEADGAVHPIVDGSRNEANTSGVATSPSSGVQVPSPALEEDDRSSGVFLSYLATTISSHGPGAVSADLALDLVLKDIVERARLATNASGAAIALMRGREMVCRATTGTSGPEPGVRLDARSELSRDSTQISKVQCCDDTEADSRVDAVACRRLGIRSFLISPLLKQGELVGLFEIFSPHPKAFGDRDTQTLQALSRQVLINVDCAAEFSTAPPGDEPPTVADAVDARFASFQVRPPKEKSARFRFGDPWTPLLLILVSALALLLGWMLGRVTWPGIAHTTGPPASGSASQEAMAIPTPPAVTAEPEVVSGQSAERQAEPSTPPPVHPNDRSPEAHSGGLTVYQDGKVIFRLNGSENVTSPSPESGGTISKPSQAPGEPSTSYSAEGFPEKTKLQLLHLVQPEYPEMARQQHIQGPVILEGKVGKDGEVQQLSVISGDSMLATAASNAVRQWRFKPVVRNGRAVQFETRIKIDFALP
jgi:TonB family protein